MNDPTKKGITLNVHPCSVGSGWPCCSPCLGGVGPVQEKSSSSGLRRGFLLSSCREHFDPSENFSSADGKCWPQMYWMRVTVSLHYCSLLPLPSNPEKLTHSPPLSKVPLVFIIWGFLGWQQERESLVSIWGQFGCCAKALHYLLPQCRWVPWVSERYNPNRGKKKKKWASQRPRKVKSPGSHPKLGTGGR